LFVKDEGLTPVELVKNEGLTPGELRARKG
jgi:hypothetical protein